MIKISILLILLNFFTIFAQNNFKIARLKYDGGGDWYNDPSAEINLLNFINDNTSIKVNPEYQFIKADDTKLFDYPFLFITGHGNIKFNEKEVINLRRFLKRGGFIYIDDDYSLDKSVRREFKKIFQDEDFIELPFNHDLYHIVFDFNFGPPKTHEHDNKAPQGFGLFYNNRMVVYYTYESNPSDGWADPRVHNDDQKTRTEALKFGTNIIVWALSN